MIVIVINSHTRGEVTDAILALAQLLHAGGGEDLDPGPQGPYVPRTAHVLFTDSAACSICLEPHARSGSVSALCGHCFHATCIARWAERARTCPMCRADLVVPSDVATAVDESSSAHSLDLYLGNLAS